MRRSRAKQLASAAGIAGVVMAAALLPSTVGATSARNELRLRGGDTLQSNAWHCSTYMRHCSWQTSAKLLGHNPSRARWIAVHSEVKGHGIRPKITLGRTTNVEITFRSRKLVRTRWINRRHWISWSAGRVSPSFSTAYVSTRSSASAYHRIFGRPRGLVAYAGAF